MNSRFCVIWAKMNHYERRLMVLSQIVDSKLLRIGSQLKKFDEKIKAKWQLKYIVQILDFFFRMSFDTLAFKVLAFASDLEIGIEVSEYY